MASEQALANAAAMGKRAGETFRDTGVPAPNPFAGDAVAELAQAWRRSYIAALRFGPVASSS